MPRPTSSDFYGRDWSRENRFDRIEARLHEWTKRLENLEQGYKAHWEAEHSYPTKVAWASNENRLSKLEEASSDLASANTRRYTEEKSLRARLDALTNAVNAHSRAVESLTSVDDSLRRRVKQLEGQQEVLPPPPEPKSWSYGGVASQVFLVGNEGPTIWLAGGRVPPNQFEAMCRSYLRYWGEDV